MLLVITGSARQRNHGYRHQKVMLIICFCHFFNNNYTKWQENVV